MPHLCYNKIQYCPTWVCCKNEPPISNKKLWDITINRRRSHVKLTDKKITVPTETMQNELCGCEQWQGSLHFQLE